MTIDNIIDNEMGIDRINMNNMIVIIEEEKDILNNNLKYAEKQLQLLHQ